jgi:uncharacterized protein (DUF2147 family)
MRAPCLDHGLSTCIALLASLLVVGSALAAPSTPVGQWRTIDDDTGKPKSLVTIWQDGGRLFGKIDEVFAADGADPNPLCTACQGSMQNKPVVGMTIIKGLELDDGEWTDGTILDPASGTEYKCTVQVAVGGRRLKVRGYVGFSLIGRTQVWQRVLSR